MTLYRTFTVVNPRVENADGSSSQALNVKSAQVTMDATWSPYCQAQLVCAQPAGAVLTAIEPRSDSNARVRFTLRQSQPGATDIDRSFDLGLRSRSLSWTAREMTLAAASDEALLTDYASETPYNYGSAGGTYYAGALVNDAISRVLSLSTTFEAGFPDGTIAYADATWDAGTTGWDYVAAIAESVGARVWCDELRVPHWATPTFSADTSLHTITDGVDTGTVLDVTDVVSRDDALWANYAVVQYSGNSPAQFVGAGATTGVRKAIVVERKRRKPGSGNAATKIRTAAQTRGRNLTVRAIADVTARPQQTWRAVYGDQDRQGIVQSVAFDFPNGTMNLIVNATN